MRLDNQSRQQAVVVDSNSGDTILSTGDLDFGDAAGPRLRLSCLTSTCSAWELIYFGTHHWGTSVQAVGDNDLSLAGALGQMDPSDYNMADRMQLQCITRLHNAELNRRERMGSMWLLWGFRYLNFEQRLDIEAIDAGSASDYRVGAYNNLWGGQLGAAIERHYGRFGWDASAKAGLFGNAAHQSTLLCDLDNQFLLRDARTRGGTPAFVGELGFSAFCQLTRRLAVRGGYNLLWIEGVALAPNQLDFTDTPASGTALSHGGGAFLHGANVGLELCW